MTPDLPAAPALDALQAMEPCGPVSAFSDTAWAFELAGGGHRVLLQFGGGAPRLHSRHHVDIGDWFPEVAGAPWPRVRRRTVLDGELCVLDASGRNDPLRLHRRALQRGLPDEPADRAVLWVRDLLVLDGLDLRGLPWTRRRQGLHSVARLDGAHLRLSRPIDGRGEWLCGQALALGRAELLAFRRDAPYQGGRCAACLRIACVPA